MAAVPIASTLQRALDARGYATLTPVQASVIEPEAAGRDLIVSAQTGSGKTVAYGLALGETLLDEGGQLPAAGRPLALVIAPTRELALQVQRELEWLYAQAGARVAACVGGMDPRRERRILADGAQLVVGTPGRLRDHLERGGLDMTALRAVVLDEADEMLDLGFREDLEFLLGAAPVERRTLLFSATLPKAIVALAASYQRDALRIRTADSEGGHADIEYRALRIAPKETEHVVVNVLRSVEAPGSIVFCNTRDAVRHLQATLVERGFSAVALSGELSQGERNHALQALRDGRARICVATDVAARGIDLPNLGLVVHAELPHDAESLQHRSGRTGRAGRKGISVLLVPPARRRRAERLLADAGVEAAWGAPPTAESVRALDRDRFLAEPLFFEEITEEDRALGATLLERHPAQDIAAALVRLHRARLPAPEEITDPGLDRAPGRGIDRDRQDRAAAGRREAMGNSVWFRTALGRRDRADPKWLLPLICRAGDVTRQEIGAIRIYDAETWFEVAGPAADRFAGATIRSDERDIEVVPARGDAPPRRESGTTSFRKPREGRSGAEPSDAGGKSGRAGGPRRGFAKAASDDGAQAPAARPYRKPEPASRPDKAGTEPLARPRGKTAKAPYKAREPNWGDDKG